MPEDLTQYRVGDTDAAIAAFVRELGADSVVTDPAELKGYRDPFTYLESDQYDASAMVMPESVEQVQAVMRIANEHGTPIWAWSQGRNNTYGGPAPRVKGSIILNMRKMNRVLEVNEDLAYAVVEPGVRWFDLYDALEAAGGRCWTSIPDLGWGSVIANSTEYGRGYTTMGDHAENLCGLEVVLPNGELVRTGMFAAENSKASHIYKHSFGPRLDGLFYQSGNGIIVRAGFWLQRRPERYASVWIKFRGNEALEMMVDRVRELLLDGTIRNYPVMMRGATFDDDGVASFSDDPEAWVVRFALYGRDEIVEANWKVVERELGTIPTANPTRHVFDGTQRDMPSHEDRVMAGIPDMDILELFKKPFGEDGAHLDFSPVGPLVGKDVVETSDLVRSYYDRTGAQFFNGLMVLHRSVLHVSSTLYDPHNEEMTRQVYDNYTAMVDIMAERGQPVYRTHHQHQDLVQSTLSFNHHALRRLGETIKDALDPNGILQPGKSGIWAERYREDRAQPEQ